MRHSEKKGGLFLGSRKNSQTVSFREHARVPPDAHRAQGHETHWTGRQKGDQEASQCVSFSQTVSLVSDRLAFAENGESSPYPRHSQVIKRRAPRRAKRMRHIEKKRSVFLRSEKSLKPSHSANMREFRPMPTALNAMRHFGQAEKRGDQEASQSVSFSQTVSRPQKTESGHPSRVTPAEIYSLSRRGRGLG